MSSVNLVGLSGSLRARSLNTALLRAAEELLPDGATLTRLDIRLPLFDSDLDDPVALSRIEAFKQAIDEADGLIIASPEYNYGIPGPLKNALDWASRPAYRSPLAHKPVTVISASPGAIGGARMQTHLRDVLAGVVALQHPWPEFTLGGAKGKFDEDLRLTDDKTRRFLEERLEDFVGFVRHARER